MAEAQELIDVINKEVVIFENSQHTEIGSKAHDEEEASFFPHRGFYQPAGDVINCDDSEQDQEISRYEGCVEIAAGYQQEEPAPFERDDIIQGGYYAEEEEKFKRVEDHILVSFSAFGAVPG
jgi:hypothetical protein